MSEYSKHDLVVKLLAATSVAYVPRGDGTRLVGFVIQDEEDVPLFAWLDALNMVRKIAKFTYEDKTRVK